MSFGTRTASRAAALSLAILARIESPPKRHHYRCTKLPLCQQFSSGHPPVIAGRHFCDFPALPDADDTASFRLLLCSVPTRVPISSCTSVSYTHLTLPT